MKSSLRPLAGAVAVSLIACSALAEHETKTSHHGKRLSHAERANRLNGASRASDVLGLTVKNYQNEKLGKVEDVAVDLESGRIVQVVLSIGGVAGIGDRQMAVPPGALHHDVAQKVVHLDATKEQLKGAPQFDLSHWAECCDSNRLYTTYQYYGEEPAFRFVQADEYVKANRDKREAYIPVARLGQVQRASKLTGLAVKNPQDEKLGKVENLLLDFSSGRVVAVVISSGGFLGLGDELSAVPPAALQYTADRGSVQLDATKDSLAASPHFKANEWPDFAQTDYTAGIYRAYRVDPYFNSNAANVPDNTARNARDRDQRNLTPLDQGNNPADLDITTRIRKAVIAERDMSVNARNVKIITRNGQVTLRGPVNSAEEKRLIGELAARVSPGVRVDNQLEIKKDATVNE